MDRTWLSACLGTGDVRCCTARLTHTHHWYSVLIRQTLLTSLRYSGKPLRSCISHHLLAPPIRKMAALPPVALTSPAPGIYVFDFGRNIAGWSQMQLPAGLAAGSNVSFLHAEVPRARIIQVHTWNSVLTASQVVDANGFVNQANFQLNGQVFYHLPGFLVPLQGILSPLPGTLAPRSRHSYLSPIYSNHHPSMKARHMSTETSPVAVPPLFLSR